MLEADQTAAAHDVRFAFREDKATAAACYLLQRAGGEMEHLRLLKLLYLADRRSLDRTGRPITGDRAVAMKHGPVLSTVYDRIKTPPAGSTWARAVKRNGYLLRLVEASADLGPLSRAELEILEEVQEEHRHQDTWTLIDWMHERLPEWRDPGDTSAPIPATDILRALEKSPAEVAVIAEDARASAYFDELFAR